MTTDTPNKFVHRDLRLGDSGPDVRKFQEGLATKAQHWKLPQYVVTADGEYGRKTSDAAWHILFAMGAGSATLKRVKAGSIGEYGQKIIRGSKARTGAMRQAETSRKPKVRKWRRGTLPTLAVQEAEKLLGVMEEGGNNAGRRVSEIIISNGGAVGEPWCGDFVAYCYRNAGSKAVTRSWASVYFLGTGLAGLKRISTPEYGCLVRFTFDHVGIFLRDLGNGEIETIEGNTGPVGAVSDGDGGDGVYRKRRSKSLVNDYIKVTR